MEVEAAVPGSPSQLNSPCGLCGRKATLNLTEPLNQTGPVDQHGGVMDMFGCWGVSLTTDQNGLGAARQRRLAVGFGKLLGVNS